MDERTIFERALDLSNPQERADFLNQVCEQNAPLRSRVEALLHSHEEAGSFLQGGVDHLPATLVQPLTEQPGTQIGPYKLLQQIGEGGMGVVYMAEQIQPVRRKVALKIIKAGMDTKEVIARFEAERQALALMDHPNVAKVFDAGVSDSGRPYFVMELVRGVPITDYCDEQKLSTRERLKLFVEICRAVQHAHQKGIIHRDLKPANVMVTLDDDRPVPKVIDFGISKAISQQLTEMTLFTAYGQMIGTPLYMSPEQAQLSMRDVDTRSDVYSLGVLLYELLTGTTPFDKEALQKSGFEEMRRIIREVEPPRPSTRISTLGAEALSTVSDRRKIDARKLSQSLRGELDWIVMKALEKDRNRRYESASAFAADVERYLDDEPVQACPPSAAYRIRKVFRRHRAALLTGAVVVVSLLGGIVVSTWQTVRARNAERLAEERLNQVNEHLTREQDSRREADLERKRAEGNLLLSIKALDEVYLQQVAQQRVLGDKSSGRSPTLTPTERRLLKVGLAFYDQLAQDNRDDDGALFASGTAQTRVGILQASLNQRDAALRSFREAITRLERLTDRTGGEPDYFTELGRAYLHYCENSPWLPRQRETLLKAETAFGRAIALDREQARTYQERARVRRLLAKYEGALADFETASRLNPKDAALQGTLAWFFLVNVQDPKLRDPQRALRHAREAVNLDPDNAGYLVILGRCLYSTGQSEQALEKLTQAIQLAPRSTEGYQQRGLVHKTAGNLEQALADANQLLEIDPTARGYRLRGEVLAALGRDQEALDDFAKAEKSSPNDPYVYFERGGLYLRRKEYEKAVADLDRGLALVPSHSWTYKRRIVALFHLGRFEDALRDVRTSIKINPKDLGGLICIGAETIASCPNEKFKESLLEIADEIIAAPGMDHAQAHHCRAELLMAMSRPKDAVADYTALSKLEPNQPVHLLNRGHARLASGDEAGAQSDFDAFLHPFHQAVEENASDWEVWNRRGIALTNMGRWDSALADFDMAAGLSPENAVVHANRAVCLCRKSRWEDSAAALERVIDLGAGNWQTNYQLALCSLGAGDWAGYRAACARLLEMKFDPANFQAQTFAAWTCALIPKANANVSRGLTLAEQAALANPDDPLARMTLGALLYRGGRFRDAIENLNQADQLVPEPNTSAVTSSAYGWYFLAMAHHQLGDLEDARTWLDRANQLTHQLLQQGRDDVPWNRRLTLTLLKQESENLLSRSPSPAIAEKQNPGPVRPEQTSTLNN